VNRQLRSPADFKGLRFRTITSATQIAALRALGAKPSTEGYVDLGAGLQSGRIGGFETDFNTYEGNGYSTVAPFMTVNAALWPRTTVLLANAAALSQLSGEQQAWIRQAADDAARYALTTFGEDSRIVPRECRNGMKAVVASPAQLDALRNAFAPVYTSLRKDPVTAKMIAAITALKRGVNATPLTIPSGCRATATPGVRSGAAPAETAFPQGVFRGKRTDADILRVWPNADAGELRANTATVTFTFKNGTFGIVLSDGGVPGCRRGEGLRFRLVQPALPLIHVIWEAIPVERIS
jgi:hypothetical protein